MPYGINQEIADATVRILGNNVKLINWFREVEDKFDAITNEIEGKLGQVDKLLQDAKYNEALDLVEFGDLLKTLRSSRRSQYGMVRNALIKMIQQILRLKRMKKDDRPIRAVINQFEVFRTLYTILINEHVENTTMIEDKIVFQIERMTTDSARVYDLGMRPYVESDDVKSSAQSSADREAKREQMLTKQLQISPQGIAGVLS